MSYIADGYKIMGTWLGDWAEKHKADIFTGISIIGTGATAVISAMDTSRAVRKIDAKELETGEELDWKEKVKLCWKDYIPTGLTVLGTDAASIASNRVSAKTITDLSASYAMLENLYERHKKKTREVVGDKKEQAIREEIAKEEVKQYFSTMKIPPQRDPNDDLWMDGYSGIIFWSNIDKLRRIEAKLQDMMNELAPRGDEYDYYDKMIGVNYGEWLSFLRLDNPDECHSVRNRRIGWNKGFAKDGSDDDVIQFYTTAMEIDQGARVVHVINWETEPTDMKLGRLIKSSGF